MRRKEKKSEIWEFSEENGISMAFSLQLKGFESYDWEVHFIEKKKKDLIVSMFVKEKNSLWSKIDKVILDLNERIVLL